MIPMADPGSGSGGAAFPDPPKGDPGAIAGVARALSSAGDELNHVNVGLRAAGASLAADWQGYAANAYHSSSEGLAACAQSGSGEFVDCAHAVSGYGGALDHAQSEIKRLRIQWEQAQRQMNAAVGLADRLGTAAASAAHPAEADRLSTQVRNAQNQAGQAGREADGYARRAQHVLDEFKQRARGYEETLAGSKPGTVGTVFGSPFAAPGTPSPGFGVPLDPFSGPGAGGVDPDGLSNLNGVIPVGDPWKSPIPGYGYYMDATTPEAVPTDDLTNLVVGVATLGGGSIADLGGNALRSIAESYGIGTAGKEAVERTEAQTVNEIFQAARANGETRYTSLSQLLKDARSQAKLAGAGTQVSQQGARADILDNALELLSKTGHSPLPSGAKEALVWLYRYGTSSITMPVRVRLDAVATRLVTSQNPALRSLGYSIRSMVRP
jgi:hypothetical protein